MTTYEELLREERELDAILDGYEEEEQYEREDRSVWNPAWF